MGVDREPRPLPREAQPPITIHIESGPDPNSSSEVLGLPATQKQIENYEITLNGQKFVFPNVWGLQTVKTDQDGKEKTESYLSPEVSQAMNDAMFRILHPKEAYIDDIINGRIEIPNQMTQVKPSNSGVLKKQD